MHTSRWIEFELAVASLGDAIRIRIRDVEDRWVASVQVGASGVEGLGGTARQALTAALAPLGARATAAVMAEPAMFGVSARLLDAAAG
jgi:hypothetical protein